MDRAPDILWAIEDWSWGTIWNIPEEGGWFGKLDLAHHRPNGLFMAAGPGIAAGLQVREAEIVDMAPTILHWMGIPVPVEMDGQVLEEIMLPSEEIPRTSASVEETGLAPGYDLEPVICSTKEESESEVWERLQGLGYLS